MMTCKQCGGQFHEHWQRCPAEPKRDCQHGRQIGKCADCEVEHLEKVITDYAALEAECERLRAELEAIKGQPAIGETCRGHQAGVIFYTWLPYPTDGTKLYALPPAKADEVSVRRELLDRLATHLEWDGDNTMTVVQYAQRCDRLAEEIRALLASGKEQP